MTTLLQTYEEEYREQVRLAQEELTALQATLHTNAPGYTAPPSSGGGSRLQRGSALNARLGQMRELLNNMEYECNDLPASLRQAAKERVRDYRQASRSLEEAVSKTRIEASAADREDLLGKTNKAATANGTNNNNNNNGSSTNSGKEGEGNSGAVANDSLDAETRQHRLNMMNNTEKFKQASKTLLRSERLLGDTETIGNEALTNLRGQTETMQHIHETTVVVDEDVSQARQVLSTMQRVMIKHKLILVSIILVLIFLIIVAIYTSVAKHSRNTPPTPTPSTVAPIIPTAPFTSTPV